MLREKGVLLDLEPTPAKFLRSLVTRKIKLVICTARAEILDRVALAAGEARLRLPVDEIAPWSQCIRLAAELEAGRKDRREGPHRNGASVSRSHRFFEPMQALRRRRGTVSGEVLARETNVSLRTIHRDIATLQAMGATHVRRRDGFGRPNRPVSRFTPAFKGNSS